MAESSVTVLHLDLGVITSKARDVESVNATLLKDVGDVFEAVCGGRGKAYKGFWQIWSCPEKEDKRM